MKEIPAEIRVLYDALLVQKEISKKLRFYYTKWLRYYLVSIHKGLFSAIFVSNCGFPCAVPLRAGYVSVSRPGGIFLDLTKRSFMNWKPIVSTLELMDGHYLDFCFKSARGGLKEKNQTDQQQKQALHAISIYFDIESADKDKRISLKNKKGILSSKKEDLKSMNANWRPVYAALNAEIKLGRIGVTA